MIYTIKNENLEVSIEDLGGTDVFHKGYKRKRILVAER